MNAKEKSITNHGRKLPYKNTHYHWDSVRKHWFDMASKTSDQNASLSFFTAFRKIHFRIKNCKHQGLWFVSMIGDLWKRKIGKFIYFPSDFNWESIIRFLWGNLYLYRPKIGFVVHIYTRVFLKAKITQLFNTIFSLMEFFTSKSQPGFVIISPPFTSYNHGKKYLKNTSIITGLQPKNIWYDIASKILSKIFCLLSHHFQEKYLNIQKWKAYNLCTWWGIW